MTSDGWATPLADRDATWRAVPQDDGLYLLGTRLARTADESEEPALAVRRIDARDGTTVWQTDLASRGGVPELTVADGIVVCRQATAVEALDADTGAYLWGIRYAVAPNGVGVGGGIYVAALPDGIVDARDARSGRHRWTLDVTPWRLERFEPVGRELFGIADGEGRRAGELAVFDLTRPSADPLWYRRGTTAAAAVVVDGVVIGTFDGPDASGVRLRDGATAFEGVADASGRWVGERRIDVHAVEGVVLRLQQVDAYLPGATEPAWSTLVPTSRDLVLQQEALGGSAILVASATTAALLDAATGAVRWTVPIEAVDAQGRSCSVLGAAPDAVLLRCVDLGRDALVAIPATSVD